MNGPVARMSVLMIGIGLIGAYFWLNQAKPVAALAALEQDLSGPPSSIWALALDKQVLISRHLPPTGIFDGEGSHQINIEPVPASLYERIREHRNRVTQVYDDKAQTSRLIAMKDFLVTQIADRRVYLVRREDARTIAGIVWNERRRIRDVVRCNDPILCRHVRIRLGRGWGRLVGPYLKTDISARRRGLPRGRWVEGPASPIAIDADGAVRAVLELRMLRLAPNQAIAIDGRVVEPASTNRPVFVGGRLLVPTLYRLPLALDKGRNVVRIAYSNWVKDGRPAVAAFVYGLGLKRPGGVKPRASADDSEDR